MYVFNFEHNSKLKVFIRRFLTYWWAGLVCARRSISCRRVALFHVGRPLTSRCVRPSITYRRAGPLYYHNSLAKSMFIKFYQSSGKKLWFYGPCNLNIVFFWPKNRIFCGNLDSLDCFKTNQPIIQQSRYCKHL